MKNECMIVRDLLPLYVEGLVSDETRAFVEEHLAGCEDCRKALAQIRTSPGATADAGVVPLKTIKKRLRQQKLKSVFLAVTLVMAVLIVGFGYLTLPQYVPYSEDLLTITENQDGMVLVSFDEDKVTGFSVSDLTQSEDGDKLVLYIYAWKTTWGLLFPDRELQNVVLKPADDDSVGLIFYSPNYHEEAVKIWGEDVDFHVVVLPRLALVYYLIFAGLAVVLGGVLLLLFRKNRQVRLWLERIVLFPAAYIVSHILTKGFTTITYSMTRDLVFILLVTILLYAAGLLGISLYRDKKEIRTIPEA